MSGSNGSVPSVDLVAVVQAVVSVSGSSGSVPWVDLVAVSQAVVIGVGIERIGPERDLLAIGEAVVVRIGVEAEGDLADVRQRRYRCDLGEVSGNGRLPAAIWAPTPGSKPIRSEIAVLTSVSTPFETNSDPMLPEKMPMLKSSKKTFRKSDRLTSIAMFAETDSQWRTGESVVATVASAARPR